MGKSQPPTTTEPLQEDELLAILTLWEEWEAAQQWGYGNEPPERPLKIETLLETIPLLLDEVGRLRGVEAYLRARLAEREPLL